MSKKRTFIVDDAPVDVEETDVQGFLEHNNGAKEAKSYILDGDTIDVMIEDIDGFEKENPGAKPLYGDDVKKKVSSEVSPEDYRSYLVNRGQGEGGNPKPASPPFQNQEPKPIYSTIDENGKQTPTSGPYTVTTTTDPNKQAQASAKIKEEQYKATKAFGEQVLQNPLYKSQRSDKYNYPTINTAIKKHAETLQKFLESDLEKYKEVKGKEIQSALESDPIYNQAKTEIENYGATQMQKINQSLQGRTVSKAEAAEINEAHKKDVDAFAAQVAARPEVKEVVDKHNEKYSQEMEARYKQQYLEHYNKAGKLDANNPGIQKMIGVVKNESFNNYTQDDRKKIIAGMVQAFDNALLKKNKHTPEQRAELTNELEGILLREATFNKNGGLTPFAIKEYAKANIPVLQKHIEQLQAEMDKQPERDKVVPSLGGQGSATMKVRGTEEQINRRAMAYRAIETYQKALDTPDDKLGSMMEGIADAAELPFIGGLIEFEKSMQLLQIAKKAQRGEKLTTEEAVLVKSQAALDNIKSQVKPSFAYSFGEGLTASGIFMFELAATGGVNAGVTKGVTKAGQKLVAKAIQDKAAGTVSVAAMENATKLLVQPIAATLGAGVQTIANPQMYMNNIVDRMTPQMSLAFDPETTKINWDVSWDTHDPMTGYRTGHGESFAEAAPRGIGQTFSDVLSEQILTVAGGITNIAQKRALQALARNSEAAKRFYTGWYLSKYKISVDNFNKLLREKNIPINSTVTEMAEDVLNEGMTNIITGDAPVSRAIYNDEGEIDWEKLAQSGAVATAFQIVPIGGALARMVNKKDVQQIGVTNNKGEKITIDMSARGYKYLLDELGGGLDKVAIKVWAEKNINRFNKDDREAAKAVINHLAGEAIFPDAKVQAQGPLPKPTETEQTPEEKAATDQNIDGKLTNSEPRYTIKTADGLVTVDDAEMIDILSDPENIQAIADGRIQIGALNPSDAVRQSVGNIASPMLADMVGQEVVKDGETGILIQTPRGFEIKTDKGVILLPESPTMFGAGVHLPLTSLKRKEKQPTPTQAEATPQPEAAPIPIESLSGKKVFYKGKEGVLTIDEGGKIEIEQGNKIYEISAAAQDDALQHGISPIRESQAEITNVTEDSATIDGVEYEIVTDQKGNIKHLVVGNKKIKDEQLIVAVEIERNRLDNETIRWSKATDQDKREAVRDADNETSEFEKNVIENILEYNMADDVDAALEALETSGDIETKDAYKAQLWAEDAINRLEKAKKDLSPASHERIDRLIDGLYTILDKLNNINDETKQRAEDKKHGNKPNVQQPNTKPKKESVDEDGGKDKEQPEEQPRNYIVGAPTERVLFANGPTIAYPGHFAIIDATDLIASHLPDGTRNPKHAALGKGQPKERNDIESIQAQESISNNPNFKELSISINAYTGTPVITPGGLVIQGNNRSIGLQKHYRRGNTKYKNDLIANAEQFGLTAEQVKGMKNPVLVRVLDVNDDTAVVLGNYTAADLETGTKGVFNPITLANKLSFKERSQLALFMFEDNEQSLNATIRANAGDIIKIIGRHMNSGERRDTWSESLPGFTKKGIEAIEELSQELLIANADDVRLRMMLNNLSSKARKNIELATKTIFQTPEHASLIPDIHEAIKAAYEFENSGDDYFKDWAKTLVMGHDVPPKDRYSPLAMEIARIITSAKTEYELLAKIKPHKNDKRPESEKVDYNKLIEGEPTGLFGGGVPGLSKAEAVEKAFGVKMEPNKPKAEAKAEQDPVEDNDAKPNDKPIPPKQRKVRDEKIKKDIDDALDDLFKPSGGPLTMNGIDPVKLSKGIKVIGLYMKAGVYKFSDIIEDAYAKYGQAISEIFDAMKAAYTGYYNTTATDEEAQKMDSSLRGVTLETIINPNQNDNNRPGDSPANRNDAKDEAPDNENDVRGNGGRGNQDGAKDKGADQTPEGGKGAGQLRPPTNGEQGDNEVDKPTGAGKPKNDDAGNIDGRGDDLFGGQGHRATNGSGKSGDSTGAKTFSEKLKKQKEAEGVEVVTGDIDNIRETLPFLLPEQQDDVLKAEKRFFNEDHKTPEAANGKGMLFTNGTGTGKTYTALGVIKRFVKRGDKKVLIVVPSSMKTTDWQQDGRNLQLDVHILKDTKDKGKDISVTTYANFRANEAIYENDYDLIVYDESHRLMENNEGKASGTTYTHYEIANKTEEDAFRRLTAYHPLWVKRKELKIEFSNIHKRLNNNLDMMDAQVQDLRSKAAKITEQINEIEEKIEQATPALKARAKKAADKTKVLFLSATPFKAHFNLRYANGFLFDWGDKTETNNKGSRVDAESRFYLQHFGSAYEWKYHRLETKPRPNEEAVAMQEAAFAENLMKQGAMSGRAIISEMDYSREFPLVSGFNSEHFNRAFSDIFKYEEAEFNHLAAAARKVFYNYHFTTQLFESLKTSASIDRIQQHLDLGRKVVVFHRRQQANATPPFATIILQTNIAAKMVLADPGANQQEKDKAMEALEQVEKFKERYKDLLEYESTLSYDNAVTQLTTAFPGKVKIINGDISPKEKNNAVREFNNDNSAFDILVVQEESGKEGISLHDTTGKKPRVLMSMSMPISTTTALQVEGRIFRIGQQSNAIFEYPLLGLDLEIAHFGNNINKRLSTTENLALGNASRDLIRSYSEGVINNSGVHPPHTEQGIGGKEYDKKHAEELTPFGKAKLVYATNQKITGTRNQRQGVDFYPTPEPLGQKMVEWADIRVGESTLEPSAGMGSIAMWVPASNNLTAIEPAFELYSRLTARAGGGGSNRILNNTFEELAPQNKYATVVMNPPFGQGGATAVKHLAKAFNHLQPGGRIVAIVPVGSTDAKIEKWLYEVDEKGKPKHPDAHMVASILLPPSTFSQAGTTVNTRVIIIDKTTSLEPSIRRDVSDSKNIGELFGRIENISVPPRNVVEKKQEEAPSEEDSLLSEINEQENTKTGEKIYVVRAIKYLGDKYKLYNETAKANGGYYSSFHTVKGWIFKDKESAEKFKAAEAKLFGDNDIMSMVGEATQAEAGSGVVVYHGSPFNRFSAKDYIPNRHGLIFFTENKNFAKKYMVKRDDLQMPKGVGAAGEAGVSKQVIYPKNTLDYKNIPQEVIDILESDGNIDHLTPERKGYGINGYNDYSEAIKDAAENGDWYLFENKKVIDKLKELGYDSIKLRNENSYNDAGQRQYEDVIAVFDKNLIKDEPAKDQSLPTQSLSEPTRRDELVANIAEGTRKLKDLQAKRRKLSDAITQASGTQQSLFGDNAKQGELFESSIDDYVQQRKDIDAQIAELVDAQDKAQTELDYIDKFNGNELFLQFEEGKASEPQKIEVDGQYYASYAEYEPQGKKSSTSVQAVWEEYGQIQFNGSAKITSHKDVALLMKNLEDAAVENAFAVHVDKDGQAHIQYLSTGTSVGTVVDPRIVATGALKYGAVKTYLVHNHPSGRAIPSETDLKLTKSIRDVFNEIGISVEHVIMDTYSREYAHIDMDGDSYKYTRDQATEETNQPYTAMYMSKQKVLSAPIANITSSTDAAQAIQQIRFTAMPKIGVLILGQTLNIIANSVSNKNMSPVKLLKFILEGIAETGVGVKVILYSNNKQSEDVIGYINKQLRNMDIRLLDVMQFNSNNDGVAGLYQSWADEGMLNEQQEKYGTNEVREPDEKPEEKELRPIDIMLFSKNTYNPSLPIKKQPIAATLRSIATMFLKQAAQDNLYYSFLEFENAINDMGYIYRDISKVHLKEIYEETIDKLTKEGAFDALVDPNKAVTPQAGLTLDADIFEKVKQVFEKYEVPVSEKKLKGALGFYQRHPRIVKVESLFNVAVAAHELMHHFQYENNMVARAKTDPALVQELKQIYLDTYPGAKENHSEDLQLTEGISMMANLYVQDPTRAQQAYPYAYMAIFNDYGLLSYSPAIAAINDLHNIVVAYQAQTEAGKIQSRIKFESEGKSPFRSYVDRLKYELYDSMMAGTKVDRMLDQTLSGDGIIANVTMLRNTRGIIQRWLQKGWGGNVAIRTYDKDGNYKDAKNQVSVQDLMKSLGTDERIKAFNTLLIARKQASDYRKIEELREAYDKLNRDASTIQGDIDVKDKAISTLETEIIDLKNEIAILQQSKSSGYRQVIAQKRSDIAQAKAKLSTAKGDLRALKELQKVNLEAMQAMQKEMERLIKIADRNKITKEQALLAEAEIKGFDKELEMFDQINENLVDYMEATGLISTDTANKYKSEPGYASFRRYLETDADMQAAYASIGSPTVYKVESTNTRTGSDLPFLPPMYSQMLAIQEILLKGAKNNVWKAWALSAAKDSAVAQMFREIANVESQGPNAIGVWVNGKLKFYEADAMVQMFANGMSMMQPDEISKILNTAAKVFTLGTTVMYPIFALTNYTVDAGSRVAITKLGTIPVIHDRESLIGAIKHCINHFVGGISRTFVDDYIAQGGTQHQRRSMTDISAFDSIRGIYDTSLKGRILAKSQIAIDVLSSATNLTEIIGRGAEYRRAVKKGLPHNVAMMLAADVSINFAKRGNWFGKNGNIGIINSLLSFISYAHASHNIFWQTLKAIKDNPLRAISVIAILAANQLAGMLVSFIFGDDDEKNMLLNKTDEDFAKYIFIPKSIFGIKSGLFQIRIPETLGFLGPYMAAYYKAIIASKALGVKVDPNYFEATKANTQILPPQYNLPKVFMEDDKAKAALGYLGRGFVPQLLSPGVQSMSNTRFYPDLMPIVSPADASDVRLQYNQYTSIFARHLGEQMHISPKHVDFLFRGYGGRTAALSIDIIEHYITKQKPEFNTENPFVVNADRYKFSGELSNAFFNKIKILEGQLEKKKEAGTINKDRAFIKQYAAYMKAKSIISSVARADREGLDINKADNKLYFDIVIASYYGQENKVLELSRQKLKDPNVSNIYRQVTKELQAMYKELSIEEQ